MWASPPARQPSSCPTHRSPLRQFRVQCGMGSCRLVGLFLAAASRTIRLMPVMHFPSQVECSQHSFCVGVIEFAEYFKCSLAEVGHVLLRHQWRHARMCVDLFDIVFGKRADTIETDLMLAHFNIYLFMECPEYAFLLSACHVGLGYSPSCQCVILRYC